MKALIQRVSSASVKVKNKTISSIKGGLLIFIGIYNDDTENDIDKICNKIINLRIFDDDSDKINLNILDIKGEILLISQFTLCANTKRGNRPSFIEAMGSSSAKMMFDALAKRLSSKGVTVFKGKFGEYMAVSINNIGPMTIQLDTKI